MSLKKLYYKLEDKYFEFLENLEKKKINLFKIVDPLEKKGIHTFPIFSLIFLGIIILVLLLIFKPISTTAEDQLNISFYDEQNNPISNQELTFYLGTDQYTRRTDNKGFVSLGDLSNISYELLLDDPNYQTAEDLIQINLLDKKNYSVTLQEKQKEITKEVVFKKEDNTAITEPFNVSFYCTNVSFETGSLEVIDGKVIVPNVPIDCGELKFSIISPSINNKYTISHQSSLDSTTSLGEIYFSDIEQEFGSLEIVVLDSERNNGLSDIQVTLMTLSGDELESGTTNANGIFVFNNYLVNSYVVLAKDNTGIYGPVTRADYDSGKYSCVQLIKNTTVDHTLKLNKDVVGYLSFNLVDKDTLSSLPNVSVKIYKGSEIVSTGTTDSQGKILFPLSEMVSYNVVFDHSDYIISTRTITPSTTQTPQEIKLTKVDQQTMQGVFVSVVDSDNKPVEFAKLNVYDSIDKTLITTTTADVRGQAIISNLVANQSYYIESVVGQYTGKSQTFSVVEREPTNVTITMNIGEGTYELTILDNTNNPISTRVRVFDSVTDDELSYKTTNTDSQGNTLIRIRADKFVYFAIDNYDSVFITKKYNVLANNVLQEKIVLPKQPTTNDIQFLGLYDYSGKSVASVSSGQVVVAKFLVNVIRDFEKVQAHIRTGQGADCDSKTYSVEQDQLYIKEIKYSGNNVVGSTTFTPCFGESKDKGSATTRDGKWFNVILDKPIIGSHIIEAEIVVNDSVSGNLPLYYRSEHISGNTILRNPVDQQLKTNVSHPEKQSLYAYAKMENIYTGASNFCENSLCYYFSVFDKSTNISRNIVDSYSASENTKYSLSFNFNFTRPISNTILSITSQSSVVLEEYTITGVGAQTTSGDTFSNIDFGNIVSGDHVSGIIDLEVVKDATDHVMFEIISDGEVVFTKKVMFDIKPSKQMNVEISPTTFVPFIPNAVVVGVQDQEENIISDAQVTIKHNSSTIEAGVTDDQGRFLFTLPSPNVSDDVEIIVRKKGYRSVVLKKQVSKNILIIVPEKIDTQLNLSTEARKEINVDIKNQTVVPFVISNISHTVPQKYLSLAITPTNNVIEPGQDISLDIKLQLTTEGFDLMTQQNLEGDIVVNVQDSLSNQTWPIKIPIKVRVTFGNSVDVIDCLNINPAQIDIRAEPLTEQEITLNLKNNCTVNAQSVSLGRINASLNFGAERQTGDFFLVVNNKTYPLSEEDVTILDAFPADQEATIKLKFKAHKLRQAITTPTIEFKTQRANLTGVDKIKGVLETNIIINDYATCIALPKEPIPVSFCGQQNQTMYQQNFGGFGAYPYDPTQFQNPYQNISNVGSPQYLSTLYNNPYPSPQYNQNVLMHNYLSQQTTNQMTGFGTSMFGCPSTRIPIRNDCAEDVELTFVSDYAITLNSDSVMTLPKGKIDYIEVTGGLQLGTFNLGVYAAPTSSVGDHSTFVGNIALQMLLPLDEIPEGCIVLSQRKFDFSSIVDHKPQKFTITNRCVADGWNLEGVRITDLKKLEFGEINFFVFGDEVSEVVTPQHRVTRQVGTEIHQIWTFEIQRSPEIQTRTDQLRTGGNAGELITDLRLLFGGLGSGVKLEPILEITYRTPRASQKQTHQKIMLIDNLQWLGYGITDGEGGDVLKDILDDKDEDKEDSQKPSKTETTQIMTGVEDGQSYALEDTEDGVCLDPHSILKDGFTGKDKYKEYGFDKILFKWDDISEDACDKGEYYCDHTQLFDTLYKKSISVVSSKSIKYKTDGSEVLFEVYDKGKIKNDGDAKDCVEVDETEFTNLKNKCSTLTNENAKECLNMIVSLLETVPEPRRKFAIIDFNVSNIVTDANLKKYIQNTGYITYNDNDTKKYQITTYQFIDYVNSYDNKNDDIYKQFLKDVFNTMKLYYGKPVSPITVDLKKLGTMSTEDILVEKYNSLFLQGDKRKIIINNSISFNEPGTYELDYVYEKKDGTQEITIKNIDLVKDIDSEDNNYSKNPFFYMPINPTIYDYSSGSDKVLFNTTTAGGATTQEGYEISVLSDIFSDWSDIQDGYLYKMNKNSSKITFADLRPLKFIFDTRTLTYLLPNNKPDNDKILSSQQPTSWEFVNNQNKLIFNNPTKFMKTYFVLNKNNKTLNFIFSSEAKPAKLSNNDLSSTRTNYTDYAYKVEQNKAVDDDIKYKDIRTIISNIQDNKMCFNINNNELKVWENPVNK